eukprot:17981_1
MSHSKSNAVIMFMSLMVIIYCIVFTFRYRDSASIMQLAEELSHTNHDQNTNIKTIKTGLSMRNPTTVKGNSQFINLNAYSHYNRTNRSIGIIPSSWQELNEQQLCTLERVSNTNNPDPLESFLRFIYKIQFSQNCTDPNTQFVIYDVNLEAKQGLGASILGSVKRNFAASLMLNRTFLLTGSYDWAHGKSYCQGKDAMQCYFLPISNCNATRILHQMKHHKDKSNIYYQGPRPLDCLFGDNIFQKTNLPHCSYKVIHINRGYRGYVMKNGDIQRWTRGTFGVLMMGYEALVTTFFLRPQPNVRKIIYEKIHKSIRKSFNERVPSVPTQNIVAFPIRASDKCKGIDNITGNKYTHQAEITCFNPLEYVQVMNSIKYFTNHNIDHVILTSEDSVFVQKVMDLMKDEAVSNVSDWHIIRNTEDFSVGEGTTTYKQTVKVFNVALDGDLGSSLEKDHIVSALSSLMFQVHLEPEYMVYGDSSTWLKIMWRWLALLNCNLEPEWHKIDGNKCIELSSPGYLNIWSKHKFVKYSYGIWKRIKAEHLEPDMFARRFGIKITTVGWKEYCERSFKTKLKF